MSSTPSATTQAPPPAVIHLVESLERGGLGRVVVDLTIELVKRGIPLRVDCLAEPGSLAGEAEAAGVPVRPLGKRPGFSSATVLRLARNWRREGVRLVHAHMAHVGLYARLAGWLAGARVLDHRHSRFALDTPRVRRMDRALLGLSSRILTVSQSLSDDYAAAGYPPDSITTIPNGIRLTRLHDAPDRRTARHRLGLSKEEGPVLVAVASLEPRKGHALILKALPILVRTHPSTRLLLVGEGPLRAELERKAAACGETKRIRFLGDVADPLTPIRAGDVMVSGSRTEGTSIALLEAMHLGVPVVATAVGGTPALLADGDAGHLVEAKTPQAFADTIAQSLADPETTRKKTDRARERAATVYGIDRMTHRVLGCYADCGVSPD